MTGTFKDPAVDPGSDNLFTLQDIFTLIGFVKNAIFRHKWTVLICMVVVSSLTFGVIKLMPRMYMVSARVMTQSSNVISTLASPGRGYTPDTTTYGLEEMLKSRETLVEIVKEADLVRLWKKKRTKLGRYKDRVFFPIFGKPSDDIIADMLIEIVDRRVSISLDGSVVVLQVEWHDPQIAFDLEKIVLNKFFEQRRNQEEAEILETIALLEKKYNAAEARFQKIAAESEDVLYQTSSLGKKQEEMEKTELQSKRPLFRRSTSSSSGASGISNEIAQIKDEIAATQEEISRLKLEHKNQLVAEKLKLTELKSLYGPQHPDVVKSERYYQLLSAQNPVPADMLSKQQSLQMALGRKQQQEASAAEEAASKPAVVVHSVKPAPTESPAPETSETDEEMKKLLLQSNLVSTEYRVAEEEKNTLGARLRNARTELEATEAAFRYRYRVTQPPIYPKGPFKPEPLKIFLAGIVLSIFLGIFLAVLVDIRSGRIIESWQIQKALDIPLLGEMTER